jgi:hypothetical protein
MNLILLIVVVILLLSLTIFDEYFFGRKHPDDRQGFPWSRGKRKR